MRSIKATPHFAVWHPKTRNKCPQRQQRIRPSQKTRSRGPYFFDAVMTLTIPYLIFSEAAEGWCIGRLIRAIMKQLIAFFLIVSNK